MENEKLHIFIFNEKDINNVTFDFRYQKLFGLNRVRENPEIKILRN